MDEAKLFPVTDKIFVEVSEFKGKQRVDIRKWYEDSDTGELKRTSKGLNMSINEWEELRKKFSDITNFVENEKK